MQRGRPGGAHVHCSRPGLRYSKAPNLPVIGIAVDPGIQPEHVQGMPMLQNTLDGEVELPIAATGALCPVIARHMRMGGVLTSSLVCTQRQDFAAGTARPVCIVVVHVQLG